LARLPHLSGKFGRPRGWRRWVMLTLLLLVVAVLGAVMYLASPGRVAKLAGDLLATMTGTDVHIDSAHLGLDGAITLQGLELRIIGMRYDAAKLFNADQVLIKYDLLSLFKGTFRARTITFINPVLHLTEQSDTGQFNYHLLQEQRRAQSLLGPSRQTLAHLPEIFIRNGQVHFGQTQNDRFNLVGIMNVSGTLTASLNTPGQYDFTMRQHYKDLLTGQTRPVLSGKIDMRRLTVAAKLEQFTFDSPQRIMLPQELRRWWDQFEPVGSLPSVRFSYDPDPDIGFHAELELSGVSITLPYGELDSRMTDVSGRFTIDNDHITITDLSGQIEHLHYLIDGEVFGLNRDAPFKLSLRTKPFAIPEKARYLLALPAKIQKHFKRFAPSGNFQALVILERQEPGGRLIYDGVVEVSQAKILYERFKYPLADVRGELRFNDEKIELVALQGQGPTGANVTINGWIAPPQEGAAVHVVVTAVDAPIDQTLYNAIPEKHRPAMDMFFHEPAYQRLIDDGLVQTKQQHDQRVDQANTRRIKRRAMEAATPNDDAGLAELRGQIDRLSAQAQIPVYDLGGKATVSTQVSRAYGLGKPYRTTVSLEIAGVHALFEYWPYPMRGTRGRLVITPDKIIVDNAEFQGLSGAHGKLTGTIALPINTEESRTPQLDLVIDNAPIDGLLLASIPQPQDYWVRQSQLKGILSADGVIHQNDHGDIDFQINIQLNNGSAQPYDGQFHIEQITGEGALTTHGFRIDSLTGRHGPGQLKLTGQAQWEDDQPWVSLDLEIDSLDLNNTAIDLLPPGDPTTDRVRQLFATYHPTGTLNANLRYRVKGDQPATYHIDLNPQRLNFIMDQQPITLNDFSGRLTATSTEIELKKWGASFGQGRFLASGKMRFTPHHTYNLTFDAQSKSIDPTTRSMLPDAVLSVIDGLSLDGAYEIHGAHLFHDPQQPTSYRFDATAVLTNASAIVGVPMKQINADLTIQATRQSDSEWPHLDLRLNARHMLAADRLISPLSVQIATGDRADRLKVRELIGHCYGGTLMGTGEILLGDAGLYRMNLVLQNVALNPFIYPEKYPDGWTGSTDPTTPRDQDAYTGTIAASLGIEGLIDQSSTLLGRGELEIRNSNLYEVPLSMALLQLLNISLPASRAFDRASASYIINNDLIRLDSIRFEAPTIEIVGVGTMQYDTLKLDLDLYTRNPASPKLGPLSDLFRVFKDELLSIHVTGTLDDPLPQATSFQGIKRSWRDVFGNSRKIDHRPLTAERGSPSRSGQ